MVWHKKTSAKQIRSSDRNLRRCLYSKEYGVVSKGTVAVSGDLFCNKNGFQKRTELAMEIIAIVVIGTCIWVYADAKQRGLNQLEWVVGCILLWILFFPLYLVKRTQFPIKK